MSEPKCTPGPWVAMPIPPMATKRVFGYGDGSGYGDGE